MLIDILHIFGTRVLFRCESDKTVLKQKYAHRVDH
jgi:hypothetical protein